MDIPSQSTFAGAEDALLVPKVPNSGYRRGRSEGTWSRPDTASNDSRLAEPHFCRDPEHEAERPRPVLSGAYPGARGHHHTGTPPSGILNRAGRSTPSLPASRIVSPTVDLRRRDDSSSREGPHWDHGSRQE